MIETRGFVTITLDEYADLIANQDFMEMLIPAIYHNCKLSWNKDKLQFDTEYLEAFMRYGNPLRYERTMKALLREEKEQLHEQ